MIREGRWSTSSCPPFRTVPPPPSRTYLFLSLEMKFSPPINNYTRGEQQHSGQSKKLTSFKTPLTKNVTSQGGNFTETSKSIVFILFTGRFHVATQGPVCSALSTFDTFAMPPYVVGVNFENPVIYLDVLQLQSLLFVA